jgi:RNA 2',3'-cyclic 3'-phosphodiesterase
MKLRSFIAVEIPAEIQGALADRISPLKKTLPKALIRWVDPQNVHLTLKFLGDVSPADLEHLCGVLAPEVAACEPFSMSVGGLGAFPSLRRARVLWIGLAAPDALMTLSRLVETVTTRLGFPSEGRSFSPHLTVARVGQGASTTDLQRIHTALEGTKIDSIGTVHANAVTIFKSDLQPGGPVYAHLYSLPMKLL